MCLGSSPPGRQCSQYFPRPPTLLPLLAVRPSLVTQDQKDRLKALEDISVRVQDLLQGLPDPLQPGAQGTVASLLHLLRQVAAPPVLLPGGGITWAGVSFPPGPELQYLQQELGGLATTLEGTLLLVAYHSSLLDRRHAKYLPVRRVTEGRVVNYNPWLLLEAKSNVEVELVTHTLQKLLSYQAKGATSQTISQMAEEVESRGGGRMARMAEQLRQAEEEGWREVSLTETFFRLDSSLHLYSSNGHVMKLSLDPFSPMVHLYQLRYEPV